VRKPGEAVFGPRAFGARAKNNFRTPFSKTTLHLNDGITVHNAFFDRRFKEDKDED
jgi:hypothetical protein